MADALIPSVCRLASPLLSRCRIWEFGSVNPGACLLIATPRLFECFETPTPRGRIRVEVRVRQTGERAGGLGIRMEAVSLCQNWGRPSPEPPGPSAREEDPSAAAHSHTVKLLTQCPSQSRVVTGPWHWPGMSTMFAQPSISRAPSPPKQELLFEAHTR